MPRSYSDKLLRKLNDYDGEETIGIKLAKVCVKAKLPALYVAVPLEVSRMTVHTWFRGGEVRPKKYALIEAFIKLVKIDLEEGRLPARNLKDAREYIESMIGKKI